MIPAPFLLYRRYSADPLAIKTSRGMAMFRRIRPPSRRLRAPFDRLLDMTRTVSSANLTVARWEGELDENVLKAPNED